MPRKGRFEFNPSNTTADGHYIVGKGRPPEHGKFRAGDGRGRGRKPKGTKNLATDFREEFDSRVTVTVGGVPKKVSRQRAVVMRLADNATKGQNSAIELALAYQQKLVGPMLELEDLRPPARNLDLDCLTVMELKVLRYLDMKIDGVVDGDLEFVGVIPVYDAGDNIPSHCLEAIKLEFSAYGIKLDLSELHRLQRRRVGGINSGEGPETSSPMQQ